MCSFPLIHRISTTAGSRRIGWRTNRIKDLKKKSQTPSSFDAGRPTAATPRFPHALPPSWRSPKAISHACRPPAVPQLPLSGAPIRCHLRYRAPVMHGSITLPFLWLIYRSIPCRCVPSLLSTGLAPPNPPNGVVAATPVRCSPELSSGPEHPRTVPERVHCPPGGAPGAPKRRA